jgi:hypothetical protein
VEDDSHLVFRQKVLGEDGSVRDGDVVMMKQPRQFSPKFGATSSHDFTQSPLKFAGKKTGIHILGPVLRATTTAV